MKTKLCAFILLLLPFAARTQSQKIPIDTARWYQLNHTYGTLGRLFDGNKDSKAFTGWSKVLYNYDAYYPLQNGETMTIDSIRIYDKEGIFATTPLTLYAITGNWERKLIATFKGEFYNRWIGPDPTRPNVFKLDTAVSNVRYLQLNINDNSFPGEIELYGSYTPSLEVPVAKRPAPAPLKNMFGINGFPWSLADNYCTWCVVEPKLQAAKSFRGFRQYLDWGKLEEGEGRYTFSPMMGGGWHLDTVYKRLQQEGIDVLATIQNIPKWLMDTYPDSLREIDNNPVRYGKPYDSPASYIEQARLGFQFAARYGQNKNLDTAIVSVYTIPQWTNQRVNEKKIGLGLVRYIECGNEQNKWWKGRKGYQTGREHAANLSAFYDGHKGTLGPGVGVKNADSTMQVVMTGIASITTDYVRGMIDWCREFRGYKPDGSLDLCFDVINYHLYANDAHNSQSGSSTRGQAPEKSNCAVVAREFVQLANTQLNGMPVWITEEGYDENAGSPLKAIPVGNKSVLETQADWVLRSGLLYAREGLGKGFYYEIYDTRPGANWKFATMGLIDKVTLQRKPAADFLYQVNREFGEYRYQETLHSDPFVDRYEYNGQAMYALVVPDETGRTAAYSLALAGADSATVYTPTIGSDTMQRKTVALDGGQLQLTVTETPVFVVPHLSANELQPVRAGRSDGLAAGLPAGSEKVTVYPNPVTNTLLVQNRTGARRWTVVLTDMKGNRLLQQPAAGTQVSIAMQRFAAGLYGVQVLDENNQPLFNRFVVKQ